MQGTVESFPESACISTSPRVSAASLVNHDSEAASWRLET